MPPWHSVNDGSDCGSISIMHSLPVQFVLAVVCSLQFACHGLWCDPQIYKLVHGHLPPHTWNIWPALLGIHFMDVWVLCHSCYKTSFQMIYSLSKTIFWLSSAVCLLLMLVMSFEFGKHLLFSMTVYISLLGTGYSFQTVLCKSAIWLCSKPSETSLLIQYHIVVIFLGFSSVFTLIA